MSTTIVQCPLGDKCPTGGRHYQDSATYREHQKMSGGEGNSTSQGDMVDDIISGLSNNPDFMSLDEWKDQQYDKYEEEMNEVLDGFSVGPDDRYISFLDEDGDYIDSDEVISDYAYEMSENEEHSGHVMVVEVCNTGNELHDMANMMAIGMEPGSEPDFPPEWKIKDDNIHIPIHWMVKNSDNSKLEELKDSVGAIREYGVLDDSTMSQLDYEGKRRAVSRADIEQYSYDYADRDMRPYEDEGEMSEDEMNSLRESREEAYREALSPDNIRRAIDDLLQEGEIDDSDMEYHASSGEYNIDNYTTETVIERAIRDNM